ncbi:MAG: coproporphyrinogen dehydrogenase HemZ [Lachnospiraceae bacterium]|nr:coproporphyrinogen dehydrogenase HemZ [Lachnospiraceae bacterium]
MIQVYYNEFKTYENDIRALLQSFFPGEEMRLGGGKSAAENAAGDVTEKAGEKPAESVSVSDAGNAGEKPSVSASASPSENAGQEPVTVDVDAICRGITRSDDRFEDKSTVKLALYNYLRELTGRELPWGTLTGIRPVRIVEMMEAKGLYAEAAREKIRAMFAVSEEKLDLMFSIHGQEQQVLERLGDYKDGYSIYINIPFCPTRCLYCSFTSNPIELWEERVDEYLEDMCRELEQIRMLAGGFESPENVRGRKLRTIYIGGDTPTALSAAQLDKLLTMVGDIFGWAEVPEMRAPETDTAAETKSRKRIAVEELTVESGRPDSITQEKLAVLLKHGVDRISINPQTMHQKTLDLIGRRHTVEQTREAYELARSMGFYNINMDLIMGLPGEDLADVRETLREIRRMKPDSLTVHALAVKRSSRLSTEGKAWGNADGVERKGQDAESTAEASEMTRLGAETAKALGLEPYYLYRQKNMAGNQDNVGYAVPGKESIYNILMMEEKHTVIGVGAGASTKFVSYSTLEGETTDQADAAGIGGARAGALPQLRKEVRRFENVKNIGDYLARIDELLEKKREFLSETV